MRTLFRLIKTIIVEFMIGYGQFLATQIGFTFVPLIFAIFLSVVFFNITQNNTYVGRFLFFSVVFLLFYFHYRCAIMGAEALRNERKKNYKK